MSDRFYLPGDWSRLPLVLDGSEFQHLFRVLRKRTGDVIELFDGKGSRAAARIERLLKRSAELVLEGPIQHTAEPEVEVLLCVAPPKGDRFRWLVEKSTELGVDRIIPLRTERSVVDPRESKLQKLDQTVIAACKQCGRDRLTEIEPIQNLRSVLALMKEDNDSSLRLVGDVAGEPVHTILLRREDAKEPVRSIQIVVGPEGGFTEPELMQIQSAGFVRVQIGSFTLRVETAAIALATLLRFSKCVHSGPSSSDASRQ